MAKLYFSYSTMNAGKSTMLLQASHNYRERGMHTLAFTSAHHHELHGGRITSRLGLSAEAETFGSGTDLFAVIGASHRQKRVDSVFVDEAQFLSKAQVWQLTDIVDKLNIPVLAYGLRTDFQGELFEGSQYLLAWADSISEIKTICHTGRKATMVVRVDDSGRAVTQGAQVEIGGNERYVSVSRAEFKRVFDGDGAIPLKQGNLFPEA